MFLLYGDQSIDLIETNWLVSYDYAGNVEKAQIDKSVIHKHQN